MKRNSLYITCLMIAGFLTGCGTVQEEQDNQQSLHSLAENSIEEADTVSNNAHEGFIILQDGQDYAELCSDTENGSVIARMYHAESLTVYDIQGDWANVSYNNLTGYVPLEYISFSKPQELVTMEESPVAETDAATEAPATVPAVETAPVNQITNNTTNNTTNNYNLFLMDKDGFEYANPVTLSNYVEDNRNAWCSTTSAYIYAKPDSSSGKREANMLYYGDSLTVLGSSGSYYYIATDSGSGYDLHGYVKQSYISFGQSPAPPEPVNATHGYVNVGSANVRSSPDKSTDSNVMFVLYQGAEFDVISYDGYWYKIDYNGTICYISHKMVEVW